MNKRLALRLQSLAPGTVTASRFELLTALVFKRAFSPAAIDPPLLQVSSPSPNYRRDVILPVSASTGLWHYWSVVYGSDLIMVECKNHSKAIGALEVDMTTKYLRRPGLARLAFLATRQAPSVQAVEAARDIYRNDGKLFVFLTDKELIELAHLGGQPVEAEAYLRRHYQRQKLTL